jgi:starch synthase
VQFAPATQDMLEDAIRRTCDLYRDTASWRRVQLNAMASDSSWRVSAAEYARLFRKLATRSANSPANDVSAKGLAKEPRSFAAYEPASLEKASGASPARPGKAPTQQDAQKS